MQALFATSAPTSIAATYRVFSGTRAFPVYDPNEEWPPRTRVDGLRKALFTTAPILLPFLAARAARPSGRQPGAGAAALLAPGTSAAILGALGARHRANLQAATRRLWWERTQVQVERERTAMRANLATSSTPGHDFKKTLFALGMYGSEQAMLAAQQQAARPGEIIDRSPGATLKHTLPTIDIRPLSSQRLWVTEPDIPRVRAFIDEARLTTQLADGVDQMLIVEAADVHSTTLSYLGETLRLTNEPPPLLAHLYPTAPGLLISAFWKASAVLPAWRGLPAPIAIGSALVDVALAARLWRQPPDDKQLQRALKIAATNTMVGLTLSATRLCPEQTATGDPAMAGSSYLLGSALMISSHWSRLTRSQKAVLPTAFIAWLASSQIRRPVPPLHVLGELLIILTPAVSGWRLTERLDGEATYVERALQAEFSRACDRAQLDALNDEIDQFRRQLAIARHALTEVADELDHDTRDKIESECAELESWIASVRLIPGGALRIS